MKNPEFKNTMEKDFTWEEAGKILNRIGKKICYNDHNE